MSFKQERLMTGGYDYKFEPPLDQLVDFTLYKPDPNAYKGAPIKH